MKKTIHSQERMIPAVCPNVNISLLWSIAIRQTGSIDKIRFIFPGFPAIRRDMKKRSAAAAVIINEPATGLIKNWVKKVPDRSGREPGSDRNSFK